MEFQMSKPFIIFYFYFYFFMFLFFWDRIIFFYAHSLISVHPRNLWDIMLNDFFLNRYIWTCESLFWPVYYISYHNLLTNNCTTCSHTVIEFLLQQQKQNEQISRLWKSSISKLLHHWLETYLRKMSSTELAGTLVTNKLVSF